MLSNKRSVPDKQANKANKKAQSVDSSIPRELASSAVIPVSGGFNHLFFNSGSVKAKPEDEFYAFNPQKQVQIKSSILPSRKKYYKYENNKYTIIDRPGNQSNNETLKRINDYLLKLTTDKNYELTGQEKSFLQEYKNNIGKKSFLRAAGLAICHVVAISRIQEVIVQVMNNSMIESKYEEVNDAVDQLFYDLADQMFSSANDTDHEIQRKEKISSVSSDFNKLSSSNIAPDEKIKIASEITLQLNNRSRNLRPGDSGNNSGIGNDCDPWIVLMKNELVIQDRAEAIQNAYNKLAQALEIEPTKPITRHHDGNLELRSSEQKIEVNNGYIRLGKQI